MTPREKPLRLYGAESEHPPLPWSWVHEQLAAAETYWVVAQASASRQPERPDHRRGSPHARPVWGVWDGKALHLSIGSPVVSRAIGRGGAVTVHLASGTDVVILEGTAAPGEPGATPSSVLALYDAKYDWSYDVAEYGALTLVQPHKAMAWRAAGRAGRDGFRTAGCWVFDRD